MRTLIRDFKMTDPVQDPDDPDRFREMSREDELRKWIAQASERHRHAFLEETAAWVEELGLIEMRKPIFLLLDKDGKPV